MTGANPDAAIKKPGVIALYKIKGNIRHPPVAFFIGVAGKGVARKDAPRHGGGRALHLQALTCLQVKRPLPLAGVDDGNAHAVLPVLLAPVRRSSLPHAGQRPSAHDNRRSMSPPQPRLNRSITVAPQPGQQVFTQSEPTKL